MSIRFTYSVQTSIILTIMCGLMLTLSMPMRFPRNNTKHMTSVTKTGSTLFNNETNTFTGKFMNETIFPAKDDVEDTREALNDRDVMNRSSSSHNLTANEQNQLNESANVVEHFHFYDLEGNRVNGSITSTGDVNVYLPSEDSKYLTGALHTLIENINSISHNRLNQKSKVKPHPRVRNSKEASFLEFITKQKQEAIKNTGTFEMQSEEKGIYADLKQARPLKFPPWSQQSRPVPWSSAQRNSYPYPPSPETSSSAHLSQANYDESSETHPKRKMKTL